MAIMRTYRARNDMVVGVQASTATAPALVASDENRKPAAAFVVAGTALVVLGAIAGWILFQVTDPAPFRPASNYVPFAGLFVVAAAVERFLEPFTIYLPPDTTETKKGLEKAVAQAVSESSADSAEVAANKQEQLNRERAERAFLIWGVATMLATLLCAGLGLLLLRSVALVPVTGVVGEDPNRFLDLVVTGLVVGAGTKPLHDLVKRIEKAKEKATDPPETN